MLVGVVDGFKLGMAHNIFIWFCQIEWTHALTAFGRSPGAKSYRFCADRRRRHNWDILCSIT